QEDNVKEETEAYLSDQKLQAGDISAPAIKPETAKPKLQPGAEAENLSDKREKIISILEGEEE
ncbi:MAG: hypothetical protein ACR2P9_05455, partial [Gammaproteobacteria bacterium]